MVFHSKLIYFNENNTSLFLFINQFHHIMEKYIFNSYQKAHLNFHRYRLRKFEEKGFSYLLFQIQRFMLTINWRNIYIIYQNLME